jgi:hypothetical protein
MERREYWMIPFELGVDDSFYLLCLVQEFRFSMDKNLDLVWNVIKILELRSDVWGIAL